nr:zinc finger protein [Hymenolepis microstoma]
MLRKTPTEHAILIFILTLAPIRNDNSYVGANVHTEGTISEEFIERYRQWRQNILAAIARIWESKQSTRSSTKSANAVITKLIASKHGEKERVFDAADRPVDKSPLHSVKETNAHSPAQFSSTVGLKAPQHTHIERKQFRCDTCESAFTHKSSLNVHIRKHTGERPYSCEECGKGFMHKSVLTKHLLTHKWIHTDEKPFRCEDCGRGFTGKYELTSHMRTHTGENPFVCNICGRQFSKNCNLDKHKCIHTGEKPFRCEDCGRGFSHKFELILHMRTHTREEPF